MAELNVVSESEKLVVVDKPAGLPTSYKNAGDQSDCLLDRVLKEFPDVGEVSGFKDYEGGLLFRLDNDTSGIVLFARQQEVFDSLQELQDQERLGKWYFALCEGNPGGLMSNPAVAKGFNLDENVNFDSTPKFAREFVNRDDTDAPGANEGINLLDVNGKYFNVTYPIGHSKKSSRKMIAVKGKNYKVKGDAQVASSLVRIVASSELETLVQVFIRKGARHQIRVHLEAVGLPIIGDQLYNARSRHPKSKERLFLHCGRVGVV